MEIYKLSDFEKGSKNHKQSHQRNFLDENNIRDIDRGNQCGARRNGWSCDDGHDGHDGHDGRNYVGRRSGSNCDNRGNGKYVGGDRLNTVSSGRRQGFADGKKGDMHNYVDDGILGETASAHGRSFSGDGSMKITDIRQAQKNLNRVNVFINEQYAFSLDIAQVVELDVKVGKVLTEDELAKCKKASEFGKAYQRALEWALLRPRSVRELKDYLARRAWRLGAEQKRKEWQKEREVAELVASGESVDEEKLEKKLRHREARARIEQKYDFTDLIVERLTSRGYVDDLRFAEYYVENRFVKKGISRRRLEIELMKKGIDRNIIDEVIGARDDGEEIKKIIAKKYGKYDEDKLIQYLCRQGFDYQLVQSLVRDYGKD